MGRVPRARARVAASNAACPLPRASVQELDAAAALGMPIPPAEPDEPKEPVMWESPCGMPVPPRRRSVWEGLKGAFSSKPRPSKDKAVDRFGDVWYLT